MLKTDGKQYHIGVGKGEVGKYCILPGDPGRCELIASYLDSPYHVGMNREYNIWNGYINGELVTVCSTGIGGPSTAIAVEELHACGARTFIRVGTCGGISTKVCAGDVVIANGAVRQDGTSLEYAPVIFPAVPSAKILFALNKASEKMECKSHVGIVQSKDSFYGQHSPKRMPVQKDLEEKWEAWKRLGVLASEMEASTLFTVGASLGADTGAVFLCVWNQERYELGLDGEENEVHNTSDAIAVATDAIRVLIEETKTL